MPTRPAPALVPPRSLPYSCRAGGQTPRCRPLASLPRLRTAPHPQRRRRAVCPDTNPAPWPAAGRHARRPIHPRRGGSVRSPLPMWCRAGMDTAASSPPGRSDRPRGSGSDVGSGQLRTRACWWRYSSRRWWRHPLQRTSWEPRGAWPRQCALPGPRISRAASLRARGRTSSGPSTGSTTCSHRTLLCAQSSRPSRWRHVPRRRKAWQRSSAREPARGVRLCCESPHGSERVCADTRPPRYSKPWRQLLGPREGLGGPS